MDHILSFIIIIFATVDSFSKSACLVHQTPLHHSFSGRIFHPKLLKLYQKQKDLMTAKKQKIGGNFGNWEILKS